jgi:hypothetical protein
MSKAQQGVQDVITVFLVFALVGFGLESKLSSLVSIKTYGWIDLVIFAAFLLAYFADVLFFGKTPTIPTIPILVPASQILPAGTTIITPTTEIPSNTSTTSTDSTLQPPVL